MYIYTPESIQPKVSIASNMILWRITIDKYIVWKVNKSDNYVEVKYTLQLTVNSFPIKLLSEDFPGNT